jgi:lysophospholipase L1-like esterase
MLRSLMFWSALPFVALQAVRVRRHAPRLVPADGPDTGVVGSGKPLRLLAIGDSIIAGVGASTLDKALVGRTAEFLAASLGREVEWRAIGRSGISSSGVVADLLPSLPVERVDVFLVSVGVNDVTSLTRTATWKRNLATLLEALAQHSPESVVAIAGLPPLHVFPLLPQPLRAVIGFRGESLDRMAREVVAGYPQAMHVRVEFETHPDRFSSDGFHPSEASYIDFGRAMSEQLAIRLAP